MKISNFKLGLGPMSKDIVNLCLEYSKIHDYPIMLIASRNQVDFDSGYAFTTESFVEYVNNNNFYDPERVLICRDHCGPYFSDLDKNLSLNDAVDRCLKTIETDVKSGFDLIHIDVSRVSQDMQESVATKLFDYALLLNPDIMFEFGSEDNTNAGLDESIANLDKQLMFVQKYKPNLKFFVTQTGSLTKQTQVGTCDPNFNKENSE
jgi:fructose/tagatose bisphosphate aldolase